MAMSLALVATWPERVEIALVLAATVKYDVRAPSIGMRAYVAAVTSAG